MCRGLRAPVGRGRQEHAELVDLEQDRRLAVHRGQQAGAGGDLVAAEMMGEAGFDEELVDDLAAVVLAGAGIGDADDVEIAAQIALGAVLAGPSARRVRRGWRRATAAAAAGARSRSCSE